MKNAVKEKKEDEEDTMMSMFGDFSRSQVEDVAVPLETHLDSNLDANPT